MLHLTFDDGPIPEVTEWVWKYPATGEATFFCVATSASTRKYNRVWHRHSGEKMLHLTL